MFDFDGVLVNTCEFWYKIHKDKNEGLTWERFSSMSNGNFIETQNEMMEKNEYVWPIGSEAHYIEALNSVFSIEDILHDCVLNLSNNYIVVIVSSASNKVISGFLEKENLRECFSDVFGYEFHYKKTEKIKHLLDKYNLSPKDAVFITDTLGDVVEATECGVRSIAITWGLHKADTFKRGNPELILDDPTKLQEEIEKMLP